MTVNPDYLVTQDEIALLRDVGYCNVGEGRIGKVERGGARNAVAANWRKCGVSANYVNYATNQVIEHLARKFCGSNPLAVGEKVAGELPDSETTETRYTIISDEQAAGLRDFTSRLARLLPELLLPEGTPETIAAIETAEKHALASAQADDLYLAEALF